MLNVNLIANDLTKVYGTATPFTATLLDTGGNPLADKTIVITINGVEYTRITDRVGKVSLNINLIYGTYYTKVHFLGDSTYNQAIKEVNVRVVDNSTPIPATKSPQNYFEVNKIPLKVIKSPGFSAKSGSDIKETKLLYFSENMTAPTFYFNSGYDGLEFEITIYLTERDFYEGFQVSDYLRRYDWDNRPVSVVTDAMDVPNGKYTMQIKDMKQTHFKHTEWKLRFKQYYENSVSFESVFNPKISSLSSIDQILVKYDKIWEYSPSEAILALQQKMAEKGWFEPFVKIQPEKVGYPAQLLLDDDLDFVRREPNGKWDWQMAGDIDTMNKSLGLGKTSVDYVDKETIEALLGEEYKFGIYKQYNILHKLGGSFL